MCTIYASCGQCCFCRRDQPMLCEQVVPNHRHATLSGGHTRLRNGDEPVGHFLGVSSFAEYAVVPEAAAIPVPDEMPFLSRVRPGRAERRAGGAPGRCRRDHRHRPPGRQAGPGPRHGVTHTIEAAEVVGTLRASVDYTRPGGTVTILGKADPNRQIALRFGSITGERRIVRSSLGGAKAADDFPACARAYLDGLIDRRLPLDAIKGAFDAVERGDVVRAVVTMHD